MRALPSMATAAWPVSAHEASRLRSCAWTVRASRCAVAGTPPASRPLPAIERNAGQGTWFGLAACGKTSQPDLRSFSNAVAVAMVRSRHSPAGRWPRLRLAESCRNSFDGGFGPLPRKRERRAGSRRAFASGRPMEWPGLYHAFLTPTLAGRLPTASRLRGCTADTGANDCERSHESLSRSEGGTHREFNRVRTLPACGTWPGERRVCRLRGEIALACHPDERRGRPDSRKGQAP